MLDIKKIDQDNLSPDQYFKEDCSSVKRQIVLHHTVSSGNAENVVHGWQFNPERVGTAFIIDSEGIIHQAFGSKYWAYHIAFSKNTNKVPEFYHNFARETNVAKGSIGIELCNWGPLLFNEKDNCYYNCYKQIVPKEQVYKLDKPFRGFTYFQKYSNKQLVALKELLTYLCATYNIDKTYDHGIWDINNRALDGDNGIFTHVSYRSDKTDCFPQEELINVLKTL